MNDIIQPFVCIIVLNYNDFEQTKNCVLSLLKINYKNFQIIITDNNSSDNSFRKLKEKFEKLTMLSLPTNGGYAYGMNRGIEYALKKNANMVLLINNDTVVNEDFLDHLVLNASKNNSIGVVTPLVLYMDNPELVYSAGGNISYLKAAGVAHGRGKKLSEINLSNKIIDFAEGCCMLVKRDVFEKKGLLNESFFMYFEEVEFSLRINKDYKIAFEPQAKIYHKCGAGIGWSEYSSLYNYYYSRNRLLLFSKSNLFYFYYVVLYSFLINIFKTVKIWLDFALTKNKRVYAIKKISSLWKGFIDGISNARKMVKDNN